ncbi:MAG: diacylglycerol kinase [Lactobacillales bacterium]|nr:diacylglycerol kinase [Lactobacillales bacterium]
MKKARIIYNPTSGKELIKRFLPDILDELESLGYETSAFATTADKNSAYEEAKRVGLLEFDLIVAAGGDGTISEIVNGIAFLEKRPKLAIIPAGTTNDYARALKIPRTNPLKAIRVLQKNQTVKMDIGKANEKYFINIAAGGGLTELTFEVPSKVKKTLGYLAYLAKGAEMLPRIKPVNLRITYNEGVYEGETSMFFVGLTNSAGGFETIAPGAKLDDGNFSLLIVKRANIFEILSILAKALNGGKHVNDPKVIYTKTSNIKLETINHKERLMINLDGEYGGDAPVQFQNLHQHLEFFVDLNLINDGVLLDYQEKKKEYEEVVNKYVHELEAVIQEGLDDDDMVGPHNY